MRPRTIPGLLLCLCLCAALALPAAASSPVALGDGQVALSDQPHVLLSTTQGDILVELWPDKAPKTVANFLAYVDAGLYDRTIFHRIIKEFVIQGGGYDPKFLPVETFPPIPNEADAEVKNLRGTLSMARTSDPNSATNQFFINLLGNRDLDKVEGDPRRPGYAVFGKVVRGMRAVETISRLPTMTYGEHQNVPSTPTMIIKAERIK